MKIVLISPCQSEDVKNHPGFIPWRVGNIFPEFLAGRRMTAQNLIRCEWVYNNTNILGNIGEYFYFSWSYIPNGYNEIIQVLP